MRFAPPSDDEITSGCPASQPIDHHTCHVPTAVHIDPELRRCPRVPLAVNGNTQTLVRREQQPNSLHQSERENWTINLTLAREPCAVSSGRVSCCFLEPACEIGWVGIPQSEPNFRDRQLGERQHALRLCHAGLFDIGGCSHPG